MITFTVPGIPKGKGRPRFARSGNRVITYTPPETAAYENAVKTAAMQAMGGRKPYGGTCEIHIMAAFPIPKSWPESKKRQARLDRIHPAKKPDLDNVMKTVCDALNGIVWKDDAQVVRAHVTKCYDDNPRVEVTVIEE
ncbi:MAG: RusA family crossover junction endodeoxyribonuclease [Oxalobacter formigenes]|nr:RusA family crossover junction endodeoxyribonuclease [Oxalobacter formigenes]